VFLEELLENWKHAVKTYLCFPSNSISHQTVTMATNAIIPSSTLDINKVSFGDIRLNKAGGKSVPIKYSGQNLQIRLPKMMYPMGVNIRDTDNGTTYQLSATLKGCDAFAKDRAGADAGELGTLYNFLLDLQEKLLQSATAQSVKWFGKSRSEAVLRDTMKAFLSPSVEKVNGEWVPTGKYPPSLRMKVPVYDGQVSMDVVSHDGKPIEVTTENLAQVFPKRVESSIAVAPSIYVTGQGFGVTWRIIFARVSPPQRMTAAQVFADEIDEELKAPVAQAPQSSGFVDRVYPDQEEEEHSEEVSVPYAETPSAAAPAPAPAPAKNRRRVVGAV
jgi:hypothetical protein